jgi:site-specific recombinase XerC
MTTNAMRTAFAAYADSHEAASIRRCWSTWNRLGSLLYSAELIESNPMPLIGRPKVPKSLPKGLGVETVSEPPFRLGTARPGHRIDGGADRTARR